LCLRVLTALGTYGTQKILSLVQLDAGSKAEVSVRGGRVIMEPKKKPKYTLAQVLAQCKPSDFKPTREDREWLSSPPVGREML
jgi:antitoxin ChpS